MPLPDHQGPDTGVIAVVLKGYPRLSETFIAQELKGLEDAGLTLRLYSMRHPTDTAQHPVHGEIKAPVTYLPEYLHHEPIRVLRGIWNARRLPGFRAALRAWLSDLPVDISRNRFRRFGQACVLASEVSDDVSRFYAHFIHTPSAVTRYASTMTGKPWSISAHAKDIWTSQDWELSENLASADWVATCTRVGRDRLTQLAPSPDRVHLIYHGLDLDRFPPRTDDDVRMLRDGHDADDPLCILSVGRAVEKKGYDVLLNALATLPADLQWRFEHIGGGDQLASLKAQAQSLGLADRITWHGAQPQSAVLAAYRRADLFVLACRIADDGDRDGLPNVLVEAQSQRLACISTRVSAVPELIIDGETGVLVTAESVANLAAAITELARDGDRRRRLGAAAEARVRGAFDMEAGLTSLVSLFERERGEHGGGPIPSAPLDDDEGLALTPPEPIREPAE